jgi:hypothetical protein
VKAQSSQSAFPVQKTVEFQDQAQEVVSCREGPQHSTRTYRADGGRQPLVWTILGKGPDSPRENEDTVAMAVDYFGTCWASQRRVETISFSSAREKASPSPSWSEVTYAGRGCWGRLEGACPPLGGISTSVHQSRAPTIGNPCLEGEKRLHEGETREAELPLIPSPPHRKS